MSEPAELSLEKQFELARLNAVLPTPEKVKVMPRDEIEDYCLQLAGMVKELAHQNLALKEICAQQLKDSLKF